MTERAGAKRINGLTLEWVDCASWATRTDALLRDPDHDVVALVSRRAIQGRRV